MPPNKKTFPLDNLTAQCSDRGLGKFDSGCEASLFSKVEIV